MYALVIQPPKKNGEPGLHLDYKQLAKTTRYPGIDKSTAVPDPCPEFSTASAEGREGQPCASISVSAEREEDPIDRCGANSKRWVKYCAWSFLNMVQTSMRREAHTESPGEGAKQRVKKSHLFPSIHLTPPGTLTASPLHSQRLG